MSACESFPGSRSCGGNDVFDVRTVAVNSGGLRAQLENDSEAIIAQTDERHEFPSC